MVGVCLEPSKLPPICIAVRVECAIAFYSLETERVGVGCAVTEPGHELTMLGRRGA